MRRVCIIETESHYEVVRNFVLSIIEQAEFVIVTNTFCAENLSAVNHSNVRIVNYQLEEAVAKDILRKAAFDYKLTTTPPSWLLYKQHQEWFEGGDLLIHNMNYWLEPYSNIYFFKKLGSFPLKSFLRFIKYLHEMRQRRKEYSRNFKNYLAPSKELFENYKMHEKLNGYIELKINRWMPKDNVRDVIQIVIPGTINSFRDYDMVISTLKDNRTKTEKKINLILLGKNSGGRNFQDHEDDKLTITTFSETLSEGEYVDYLRSADFGILPLKREVENLGILEVKGSSNISGGVNDFYYAGLRGLVPGFYAGNDAELITSFTNQDDLKDQIERMIRKLSKKMKEMSSQNAKVSLHNQNLINGSA